MTIFFLTFYFLVSLGLAAEEMSHEKHLGYALLVFILWPFGLSFSLAEVVRRHDDK